MKVRLAKLEDLSDLVSLWWELQSSQFEYDLFFYNTKSEQISKKISAEYFKFCLRKKNHILIVIEDEQKPIGMLHCEISIRPPVLKEEKIAEIVEAVVTERFRGRGIFQLMFKFLEQELNRRNIRMCIISVDKDNLNALRAYEKSGFQERQKKMIFKFTK